MVLPEKIKAQPRISKKEFFKFLKERQGLLEGVVICGGEPTTLKNLPGFIEKIKELRYPVKLDTNGSNPGMLKKLIEERIIDYIAMDIKGPKENYSKFVGAKVDIKKIQKSTDVLKGGKVDYEFRSTILPRLHRKEDVINMAKWIRGAKIYYLQQFRPERTINPDYEKYKPFTQKKLESIQKECNKYVLTKLRS